MKRLAIITAFLFSTAPIFAQETFSVGAGLTSNAIKGLDYKFGEQLGYFTSLQVSTRVNDHFGATGELTFINNHTVILDEGFNLFTVAPSFTFDIYPSDAFSVNLGWQLSQVVGARYDGESVDVDNFTSVFWALGLSHSIGERFKVSMRYNLPIDDDYFDWSAQLGVYYKFKTRTQ